jgi:hypothetical protein
MLKRLLGWLTAPSAPSVAPGAVLVAGHGRMASLAPGTVATRARDAAQGMGIARQDLICNNTSSGGLATAIISHVGPPETAARRPSGPVADAGVLDVLTGTEGSWTVFTRGIAFPWPEHLLVRVNDEAHGPGPSRVPFHLCVTYSGDEIIYFEGPFDTAPHADEVVGANQTVVESNLDAPIPWVEVSYRVDTDAWRQRMHWATLPQGIVVLVGQAREGDEHGLFATAKTMAEQMMK